MSILSAILPEIQRVAGEVSPDIEVAMSIGGREEIRMSMLSEHAGWHAGLGFIGHSDTTVSYFNESGGTTYEISDPEFVNKLLEAVRADFNSSLLRQTPSPHCLTWI